MAQENFITAANKKGLPLPKSSMLFKDAGTTGGGEVGETDSKRRLLHTFSKWFNQTTSRDSVWMDKAKESFHYYTNNSWSPADLRVLAEEKRPALRLNQVRAFVNVVLGIAVSQKTNLRVTTETPSDDDTAVVLDKLIRHIESRSNYDSIKQQVLRDGLIGGRGWREGYVDYTDNPLGELKYRYVPSHHVKFDSYATSLAHIQWMFRAKWFTPDQYTKIFPGKTPGSVGNNGIFSRWEEEEVFAKGEMGERILVVEAWWKDIMLKWFTIELGTAQFKRFDTRAEAEEAAVGNQAVVSRKVRVIKTTTLSGDRFLSEVIESPYGPRAFPLFPYFPDNVQGVTDGIVEDMKDVQTMSNKVGSQLLHITNQTANRSILFHENSVDSEEVATQQLNKAGGYVVWRGQRPEAMDPPAFPSELFAIQDRAESLFRLVSGITPATQGIAAGSRESGAATTKRQQASGNVLAPAIMEWHQSEIIRGIWTIDAAQRLLTFPHIMRIVGADDQKETIELNQPSIVNGVLKIVNDLTVGLYDVRLDNVPAKATLREENLQRLVELRQAGAPIPTELIIEFMDGIPSDLKLRLIQGIQEAAKAAAENPGAQVQA